MLWAQQGYGHECASYCQSSSVFVCFQHGHRESDSSCSWLVSSDYQLTVPATCVLVSHTVNMSVSPASHTTFPAFLCCNFQKQKSAGRERGCAAATRLNVETVPINGLKHSKQPSWKVIQLFSYRETYLSIQIVPIWFGGSWNVCNRCLPSLHYNEPQWQNNNTKLKTSAAIQKSWQEVAVVVFHCRDLDFFSKEVNSNHKSGSGYGTDYCGKSWQTFFTLNIIIWLVYIKHVSNKGHVWDLSCPPPLRNTF